MRHVLFEYLGLLLDVLNILSFHIGLLKGKNHNLRLPDSSPSGQPAEAYPTLENKHSHIFHVGTIKRVSIWLLLSALEACSAFFNRRCAEET